MPALPVTFPNEASYPQQSKKGNSRGEGKIKLAGGE